VLAPKSQSETPVVSQGILDGASTAYVLSGQPFGSGANGLNLTSWSFYAGTGGRSITPLLLEFSSGNTYVVRGIGQTVTPSSAGAQTNLAFNVITGSAAITNANFYFGWKDGSTTSANQGVISWSGSGAEQVQSLTGNSSTNITTAGLSLDFGNTSLDSRTYSVQATASAIPEPSTNAALAAVAVLGFAFYRRLRRS
jgi:hypothetical protein